MSRSPNRQTEIMMRIASELGFTPAPDRVHWYRGFDGELIGDCSEGLDVLPNFPPVIS
jgi:hypothetical protein